MTQIQTADGTSITGPRPVAQTAALSKSIWIALAFVIVVQGTVIVLEWSFRQTTVRPLRRPLSELPSPMGAWTGKEAQLDPRTFAAVGADYQVDRLYSNASGGAISVHCSTWMSSDEWTPHPPSMCYPMNGWELLDSHLVSLPERPASQIAVETYKQSGRRVVVAYWYQLDERTYVDRTGARSVRRAQWGRRGWPPLTKTLLQTDDSPNAEEQLLELATRIYDFHREL